MKKYTLVVLATLGLGAVSLEAKKSDSHVVSRSELEEYEQASRDLKVEINFAETKKSFYTKEQQNQINELKKKNQQLHAIIQKLKHAKADKYTVKQLENMKTEIARLLLYITLTACIYEL